MKKLKLSFLVCLLFPIISLAQCPAGQSELIVNIIPDNYPQESSWKLFVDNLEVEAGTSNSDTLCVDTTACIRFEMYDSYGDGIWAASGGTGQGAFHILFLGDTIATGGQFAYESIHESNCIADTAEILTALQAMIAHVNNSIPLSLAQREAYWFDIIWDYKDVFATISSEVYQYVSDYEANYPVIFQNRSQVDISTLSPETRLLIDFEQFILDSVVNSANANSLEGIEFEFSNIYPGPVAASAPRISNAVLEINGNHTHIPAAITAFDLDQAKRPTGYYAAPGEIVTITIPTSLIGAGLVAQIGVHGDDLSNRTEVNRLHRITKDFELNQVSTQIISPLGGGIYIKIPEPSNLGWFNITIDQAVKSPYFSIRTGHESLLTDWQTELSSHATEWVDIEGDKFMITLPWAHVQNLSDPTSMITQWNSIMDGYNFLGGRPSDQRSKAEYFAVDCMLPNSGAFGIGYPQIIGESKAPFGPFGSTEYYPTQVLNTNPHLSDLNITFHELGHAAAHPKLETERETLVNMYAAFIFDSLYNVPLDEAFKHSEFQLMSLNEAAIDWMVTHNFRDNINMSCDPVLTADICDELRYQHRGHAKYIEMAKHFGWGTIHNMNKVFYDQDVINPGVWDDIFKTPEEMIAAASDGNGINMSPLFHFWGLAPSDTLAERLENDYGFNLELCEMLHYYKTIVPQSSAEIQSYYANLDHNNWIMDIRYDIYEAEYDTEHYYDSIQAQIDYLIARYGGCEAPLSISEMEISANVSVSPVPSTGKIYVHIDGVKAKGINVIDNTGRIVLTKENINNSDFSFDLKAPAGTYFLFIETGFEVLRKKIILVK